MPHQLCSSGSTGAETVITAVCYAVAIFPAGEGTVAIDTLSARLGAVLCSSAVEARPAVGLANTVVAHLPISTLRVGFTDDMATTVDADEAVFAGIVENALSAQWRVVEADAINATLAAGTVVEGIALVGAEPISTQLVDAAIVVFSAEILADGADTVDARFAWLALFSGSAGHILGFGDATPVFARLFSTTLAIGRAEWTTLAAVAVGAVFALVVFETDVEGDTGTVFAAHGVFVTVVVGEALGHPIIDGTIGIFHLVPREHRVVGIFVQRRNLPFRADPVHTNTVGAVIVESTAWLADTVGAAGGIFATFVLLRVRIALISADTIYARAFGALTVVFTLGAGDTATVDAELVVRAITVSGARRHTEAIEAADLVGKTLGAVDTSPWWDTTALVADPTVAFIVFRTRLGVPAWNLGVTIAVSGAPLSVEAVVVVGARDSAPISTADLPGPADRAGAQVLCRRPDLTDIESINHGGVVAPIAGREHGQHGERDGCSNGGL